MKSLRTILVALAVALFALPAAVSAQSVYAGAGLTIPVGEYGGSDAGDTNADPGWLGVAGVTVDIGDSGLWAYGEGFYGQNNHADDAEFPGKTNPYGAMGGLGYGFGDGESLGLYVFGGAGLMVHKYSPDTGDSDSESQFGYQAGAGAGIPLGDSFGVWAEGRFMGSKDTTFIGILGGFSVQLGGGDGM
jgi:opacity protein-like surface antigen